jgi:sec-independent protein translocase protein TatC
MFLAGVAFAYYVALPPALGFLLNFGSGIAESQIRIENYINVVIRLILMVGLVFETPIIIMLMARLGLVTPQWLAKRRKLWIILSFVLAAIITPTFDPINQMIIAFPLIILLELSIWLSRLVYKKRGEATAAAES